jgi:hypothetical protein
LKPIKTSRLSRKSKNLQQLIPINHEFPSIMQTDKNVTGTTGKIYNPFHDLQYNNNHSKRVKTMHPARLHHQDKFRKTETQFMLTTALK